MSTVLIVEDDDPTAKLVENLLVPLGCNVQIAGTARQAIQWLQTNVPDLILLDLRLPGMSGWELSQLLRTECGLTQVPIIAISITVDPSDRERALSSGCNDYISKPFDIRQLREQVRAYLSLP